MISGNVKLCCTFQEYNFWLKNMKAHQLKLKMKKGHQYYEKHF